MKNLKNSYLTLLAIGLVSLSACDKKEDTATPAPTVLEIKTIADLDGSKTTGNGGTYFSLSTGLEVKGADTLTNKWDIKFTRSSILVNSGTSGGGSTQAQVVNGVFENLSTAPTDGYKADAAGTPATAGWYTYTGPGVPPHAILVVPGKIVVLKTAENKYAKLEMLSYYKGNPNPTSAAFTDMATRTPSRYYTFRYVLQPNGSTKLN
ncbi:MAG: hypothetical protein EAY66_02740 [Sphingobacteriales bacterium]|jgi:hypothetical protein|nr:MAG: hypothetical protein EAY66_02740 [Sphingobacteriales bacterium]